MTQILIHRAEHGIVLATDSRAVVFSGESEDESKHFMVLKIFHPLPNVVLITGGAGYGLWLCEKFEHYILENDLNDVTAAADAAISFLQPLSEALKKKHHPSADRPQLDRFYVIVAGIHHAEAEPPAVDVRLFASDQATDPLHAVEVETVVTIPRQVTLEYRLSHIRQEEVTLDAIERLFEKFLRNTAEMDEDVGPPFHFVRIEPTGIHVRTSKEEPAAGVV